MMRRKDQAHIFERYPCLSVGFQVANIFKRCLSPPFDARNPPDRVRIVHEKYRWLKNVVDERVFPA